MATPPPKTRRVKLNDDDLTTEAGLGLLGVLEQITADGTVTKDEVRELGAWLESVPDSPAVPGIHCLREEVTGILADTRITEAELRVLRESILRVLPAKARDAAKARFYDARQKATIEKELARGFDRTLPSPATDAQRAFIGDLGGTCPDDLNIGDASRMIDALLTGRPTVRQRMVLRFWDRLDLMDAGVEGVSAWMDQWYAEDSDRLDAWTLWKRESGDAGVRAPAGVDLVPLGAGQKYLARVKAKPVTSVAFTAPPEKASPIVWFVIVAITILVATWIIW